MNSIELAKAIYEKETQNGKQANSIVKAKKGSWITLSEWEEDKAICVKTLLWEKQ